MFRMEAVLSSASEDERYQAMACSVLSSERRMLWLAVGHGLQFDTAL